MNLIQNSSNRQVLSQVLLTFLTAVISVAGVIATTKFLGPLPLSLSQTISQKQNLFSVTGESEVVTTPDQVEVVLGIDQTNAQLAAAQDQANTVINQISQQLQDMGIDKEDIKTQNYSIYPQYDYESPQRRITGYSVNAQLKVKLTDFELLNQTIDTATNLGANQVGNINFSLSQDKEDELRKQAREDAIQEAKDNAQELARLSGVNLGKVVDVYEQKMGDNPVPMYARAEDLALSSGMGGGELTQIEPGESTYRYSVTLSYETL